MLREINTYQNGSTKAVYKKTPKKKPPKTTARPTIGTWSVLVRIIYLIFGVALGASACYFWLYINYVEPRMPAPDAGRLGYILMQVRPAWYAWSAGILITLITSCTILGRYLLYRKAYEYAWAKTQTRTRDKLSTLTAQLEVSTTISKLCQDKLANALQDISFLRAWKTSVLRATREPLDREEKTHNILLLK